jgi:hypothetical protein
MSKIFVFGSNLSGRHGRGAAKFAREHYGAIYGQATGLQGDSFAIPTKDEKLNTLSLDRIKKYVEAFLMFAQQNPEYEFQLTNIGCGLAGYLPADIAPMFKDAPENVIQSKEFLLHHKVIEALEKYWLPIKKEN